MELEEAIRNRRAIFPPAFSGKKIPEEEIKEILELANWAPSHRHTEPWRFIVVSESAKEALADQAHILYEKLNTPQKFDVNKQKRTRKKVIQSSHVIIITMHRDPKERVPEWEEIAATAMSVQNMWLACHAKGIGGYWSSPFWMKGLKQYFELEANEIVMGLFYMGYSQLEHPVGKRGNWEEKVKWLK